MSDKMCYDKVVSKELSTTDATATAIDSIAIPDDTTVMIEATVVAHCTGGAGGNAGDGAGYKVIGTFKRTGGAGPVQVGQDSIPANFPHEDAGVAGWSAAFNINGNSVEIKVTGGATDNADWRSYVRVMPLI